MVCLNIVGHFHSEFPPIGVWPACSIQLVEMLSCPSDSDRAILDQEMLGLMEMLSMVLRYKIAKIHVR